jgi:tetratricopeptide (TPR) repeat protein
MRDRLATLRKLVAENPGNLLAQYGLAMACAGAGHFEEALAGFRQVLAMDPDYAVAYFQTGQAQEKLGRLEEARQTYQRGIEVTTRLGQHHARQQLESALELLG